MEKIIITPFIVKEISRNLIARCNENLEKNNDDLELATGKGAAKFGFGEFHNSPNSIRGIMLKDSNVTEHIKISYKIQARNSKKRISNKLILDTFNGKYFYNKFKQAEKGKLRIELSGMYAKVFFIFLGYKNLKDFLEKNKHNIPESEFLKQKKISSIDSDDISKYAISFLAYYFSYRENRIKKFLLEIDPLNEMKVRQTGFHYASSTPNYDVEEDIDSSKIYNGKAKILENALHLNLEGVKDEETNFMNILLYIGGMNISEMKILRGSLHTMSAHGYIFSAEIFLMKIIRNKSISTAKLLTDKYDENDDDVLQIKKYLFLQRRTYRIPTSTEQEIEKVPAKRFGLNDIDVMIGIWRIWGLDQKNRILQSKLIINKDLSAYLYTNSERNDEKQLCILRLSNGRNGLNLWVSAHQQYGTELRNVAVIDVPEQKLEQAYVITKGVANGLGVVNSEFSHSPIVLMKLQEEEFNSRQMKPNDIRLILEKEPHKEAFNELKEMAKKRNRDNDLFHDYEDRLKKITDSYENSGFE